MGESFLVPNELTALDIIYGLLLQRILIVNIRKFNGFSYDLLIRLFCKYTRVDAIRIVPISKKEKY